MNAKLQGNGSDAPSLSGSHEQRQDIKRIVVLYIAWLVAAAVLGIPHGPGHSIASMTAVQTIYNIALPIWLGSLVGIVALLAIRAYHRPGEGSAIRAYHRPLPV